MRVLIVRLGSMGDVLHALPAVAALRAAHPDAHIGWAIERRWTPLLTASPTLAGVANVGALSRQQPLVDRIHVVDTLGWRRAPFSDATWSDIRSTFRALRAERYDFAIDFQGAIKSALVAQFAGATSRIGFAQPREKPATMFYTHLVQPKGRHIIDQNFSLVAPLCPSVPPVVSASLPRSSAPTAVDDVPSRPFASFAVDLLPLDPAAESEIDRKLNQTNDQRLATAILNPGAGWPAKQWPASRYAEVARALHDDGIFSLVNYGPGEEPLAREVERLSDGVAQPILCTFPELIALTRRASLFIGGDTGPMHLAALLDVPVVALFGPTDPERNGPYHFSEKGDRGSAGILPAVPLASGQRQSTIVHRQSALSFVLRHPASRTITTHSSDPDPGLLQITADEVIAAARDLLSRVPRPAPRSPQS